MKNSLYLLLLLSTFLFTACSDDEPEPEPTFLEMSAGVWEGTFEGPDNGTWQLTLQKDGSLTGFIRSENIPGIDFPGTGSLQPNGDMKAVLDLSVAGSDAKAELNGKVVGDNITGTWFNEAFGAGVGGTLQGSKVSELP
jgi:hypothetical protein